MNSERLYLSKNQHPSIQKIFKNLWVHLSKKRKLQIFSLFGFMILSGIAEVLTLAAVFPFLGVLINPDLIFRLSWVKSFLNSQGINQTQNLILPLTFIFIVTAILAFLIKTITFWLNQRVAVAIGCDLSCKAYFFTLNKSYLKHTQDNSSSIIAIISQHVSDTVDVINQSLQFLTGLVITLFIFVTLLFTSFYAAISTGVIFGTLYFIISFTIKTKLKKYSRKKTHYKSKQIRSLQEGLGGIREVIMSDSQSSYAAMYRDSDFPLRLYEAKSQFMAISPKFLIEAIGIILIALISIILFYKSSNPNEVIPIMATFALGAQKLLPSMQLSFSALTTIKGNLYAVVKVLKIINEFKGNKILETYPKKIDFNDLIQLKNIKFKYSKKSSLVIDNISLEIKKGERIGFIGKSGCGKSTLLEIIMGLLNPTSGNLYVDNVQINNNRNKKLIRQWRQSISYVPQSIYLSDATISENIAFGIPKEKINFQLVQESAKKARLEDFIMSKKYRYNTIVGERGIQLSGGQRQRIGIARALYRQNKIIVFDEATSSLDNKTEDDIMRTIEALEKDLTILIIAHRLSTLKSCDRILRIKDGKISEVNSRV